MSMHSDKEKKRDEGVLSKIINAVFGKTTDIKKLKSRSERELAKIEKK